MTHYRVPFFDALRLRLAAQDCDLSVAYGAGTESEAVKHDAAELPWGIRLATRYWANGRVCWQPFGALVDTADMVVLTPENKLVYNLWVQRTARCRLALWGHGANLQGDPHSLRERFKRRVANWADWWFAYTEHSRPLVLASRFPDERVTVLNNAVDTASMSRAVAALRPEDLQALKTELGLDDGPVAIFLGSLYADKRIDFLLASARGVRERVPGFQLLLVGAGPEQARVQAFCAQHRWARYAGPLVDERKVAALRLADVMLNPGLVGLGILDSFVCGVPMVTTDCGLHSPEIAYLENGVNGLMTADSQDAFVHVTVAAMTEPSTIPRLRVGCAAAAERYTVPRMATRFADGVHACLNAPRRRQPGAAAVPTTSSTKP